jgi:endonuclease/exonuclease/phosphatase (EEP) superfamily protein YafD
MVKIKIAESVQWILIGCIVIISLLFLFPPDFLLAKQFSEYAIHWLVICLLIGILSLFLGNEKFLYTGFIASGILAFYLMNSFNTDLRLANFNNGNAVTVLFANLTLGSDEEEKTINALYQKDADIIVLEEFTPNMVAYLQKLKVRYPYQFMLPRIDPYGKAFISKLRIQNHQTSELFGIPVLELKLIFGFNEPLNLLIVNSLPPLTMKSYQDLSFFLDSLASRIHSELESTILAANFNLVPWSRELRNFRIKGNLISSRRDNTDGTNYATGFGILNAPNNEIFYSKNLECSMFHVIKDSKSNPIGLYGRYQKKENDLQTN